MDPWQEHGPTVLLLVKDDVRDEVVTLLVGRNRYTWLCFRRFYSCGKFTSHSPGCLWCSSLRLECEGFRLGLRLDGRLNNQKEQIRCFTQTVFRLKNTECFMILQHKQTFDETSRPVGVTLPVGQIHSFFSFLTRPNWTSRRVHSILCLTIFFFFFFVFLPPSNGSSVPSSPERAA